MILQIFTVYDIKARAYLPPFFVPSIDVAKRTFLDAALETDHQFGKHPEDYNLMHLGQFNDENGTFNILESKVSLGLAIEHKAAYENFMAVTRKNITLGNATQEEVQQTLEDIRNS